MHAADVGKSPSAGLHLGPRVRVAKCVSCRRTADLRRDGYLELNLHRDGNEYAEITECECDAPEQHNDD